MARSSSPVLLVVGLGVVGATVAVVALMLSDATPSLDAGGAPVASRATHERSMDTVQPVSGSEGTSPLRGAGRAADTEPRDAAALADEPTARRVSGRLVRRSDGSPLGGGELRAQRAATELDDEGRFTLPSVGVDEHSLLLVRGSHASAVDLPLGEGPLDDLVLSVDTGWLVRGRLADERGGPVPDGRVTLRLPGDDEPLAAARSDAAGGFVLRDVWPPAGAGRTLELGALGEWHAPASRLLELPDALRLLDGADLDLGAAGALAGVLRGAEAGARVLLPWTEDVGWVEDAPPGLEAACDEDGAYRIGGVPSGSYLAVLRSSGAGVYLDARVGVTVTVGETTWLDWDVGASAGSAGADVSGRVLDAAGRPQPGASVSARWELDVPAPGRLGTWSSILAGGRAESRDTGLEKCTVVSVRVGSATTGADGRYALGPLPAGRVVVSASLPDTPGLAPASETLALTRFASWPGVDLVLGAGLAVRGRALDEHGAPLPDARVLIVPRSDVLSYDDDEFVPVDDDGRFELGGLLPGEYTLLARCPGHRDALSQVTAGGAELDLLLASAPLLLGTVLDGTDARPLTGFHLRVEDASLFIEVDWTSLDGRFSLDSLAEGRYTLTVSAPGFVDEVVPDLELLRGVPVDVTVTMRR